MQGRSCPDVFTSPRRIFAFWSEVIQKRFARLHGDGEQSASPEKASGSVDGAQGFEWERGATEIRTYCFSDEGRKKGTVKVYIMAEDLARGEVGSNAIVFDQVEAWFSKRALTLRLISTDGRTWVLRAVRLFDLIVEGECGWSLSSTKQKVSITLKKEDPNNKWQQLTDKPQGTGRLSIENFI